MTQANSDAPVILTVVIASLLLAMLGLYGISQFPQPVEPQVIDVPTAAEIAAIVLDGIETPETSNYDDILNKICESDMVDCYGTYIAKSVKDGVASTVYTSEMLVPGFGTFNASKDFKELIDLDETYIPTVTVRYDGEREVTAISKDARDDGDFTVKQLVRVAWEDDDLDETQYAYYIITSTIEDYGIDNDCDLISFEQSYRDFEFN